MATGGEAVVEQLHASGVTLAYGIPAVHNLPIYDALHDTTEIRNVLVRHEQGAGFMAIGSAYSSGEPAACIVGCGPGASNLVTPVAEAYLDSSPMAVIAGGIRSGTGGKGALHDIDQLAIFRSITKSSARVAEADAIADHVAAAVSECRSGRPRPVFLEVPFDMLAGQSRATIWARATEKDAPAERDVLIAVADLLGRAERPLIIIGGGVNTSRSWDPLKRLAETLLAPVASTISAKGAFPEDSPLSIGQLWDEVGMTAATDADVVLALGCRFSERSTASWRLRIRGNLIHVDVDPAELGRNYRPTIGIRCGINGFISPLLELVGSPVNVSARTEWARSLGAAWEGRRRRLAVSGTPSGTPIRPQEIVRGVEEAIPSGALVVAETGHAFWWSQQMLTVRTPRSYLSPAGNSTLGFGLPAAIGAKLASQDRPVVCLAGDGGFLLTSQELLTAVEEKVGIVVVIFDDGGYSAIREYQRTGYGGRLTKVDFERPDFAGMALSMGADGAVIERADEIQPAVRAALGRSRPTVIDVPISRDASALPKFFTETYRRS